MEGDDFLEESEDDDDDLVTVTDFFWDTSFTDCLAFNVSLLGLTTPRELDRLFFSTLFRGGDLIFSSVMDRLLAVFTIGVF